MDAARSHVERLFADAAAAHAASAAALPDAIVAAAAAIRRALDRGGRVLACGNGGSACDALHFTAELVGRFERERAGLAAVALSADTAILTAVGNDYGFDTVYARQVQALGRAGDVLVVLTTSGRSGNVVAAIEAAHGAGLGVIALTGRDGGTVAARLGSGDVEVRVPHTVTARIQEVHILALHCICALLDAPGGAAP